MDDGMTDIEALAAIEAAATPGPWKQADHIGEPHAIVAAARPMMSLLGLDGDGMAIVIDARDAVLVVQARNALPGLLAELRALRAGAAAARAVLQRLGEMTMEQLQYEADGIVDEALAKLDGRTLST